MKSRWKQTISLALLLLILISSIPSYAAAGRFKDVKSSHWAYRYIEDMGKLGFLKGFTDGTFQPDGILTFMQSMSALSSFINPTADDKVEASYEYNDILNRLGISQLWEIDAVSTALYYDVIDTSRLESLKNSGNLSKPISRSDFSEYLVKAMGLEEEANNQGIINLPYKDVLSIPAYQHKYLNILLKAGVLTPEGKGDKMFAPKDSLNRAEMAKMLSVAYDYLKANPNIKDPRPESTEIVKGQIARIVEGSTRDVLFLYDDANRETAYYFNDKTPIKIDGKKASYLDLAQGQNVELEVKRNSTDIVEIEARSIEEEIEGKIKSINVNNSKLVVEYIVGKNTLSREYTVDKNAEIYLDGYATKLKDLKVGNFGEFKTLNGVIYDIDLKSQSLKVEGIVKEIGPVKDSKDKEFYIIIEDSKENLYEFLIDEKTIIYKNDRRTNNPEDIKLKDDAYIEGEYNIDKKQYIAYDIDAIVVVRNIKGVITAINTRLHQSTELIIYNQETKEEETYILGKDVRIRVDKQTTNSFDLKTGYYVEIKTEGDEIVEIEADARGVETSVLGKIVAINPRSSTVTIEVQDYSFENEKYGKEVNVYVKGDTTIVNKNFNKVSFDYLVKNDIINVVGSYDGSTFVANTIQIR